MRVLVSNHLTAIAYGADVPHNDLGKVVVVKPGRQHVTHEDAAFLSESPSFDKHARSGAFRFVHDEKPEPVVEAAPPLTPPPTGTSTAGNEDPRARKPKESDKSYAARMAKLDEDNAAADEKARKDAEFLATYGAMTDEEKAAVYPTLTDAEKALIDGSVKTG